jgi:hypothetical protein
VGGSIFLRVAGINFVYELKFKPLKTLLIDIPRIFRIEESFLKYSSNCYYEYSAYILFFNFILSLKNLRKGVDAWFIPSPPTGVHVCVCTYVVYILKLN